MKEVMLSRGKTLVSDEDYDWAMQWKWCLDAQGYARRSQRYGLRADNKKYTFHLHRELAKRIFGEVPKGYRVDHKDNNPLNNQRENLRPCTHAENLANRGRTKSNTSGYKGVWFHKASNLWTAELKKDYKKVNLGYFKDKMDAVSARMSASSQIFGEFSNED